MAGLLRIFSPVCNSLNSSFVRGVRTQVQPACQELSENVPRYTFFVKAVEASPACQKLKSKMYPGTGTSGKETPPLLLNYHSVCRSILTTVLTVVTSV